MAHYRKSGTFKEKETIVRYLEAYNRTYLKKEIWNEQIIRKLEPFSYFLEVAAQMNGRVLNFSKVGRDIGVDIKTVQSYFQISTRHGATSFDILLKIIQLPFAHQSFYHDLIEALKNLRRSFHVICMLKGLPSI